MPKKELISKLELLAEKVGAKKERSRIKQELRVIRSQMCLKDREILLEFINKVEA